MQANSPLTTDCGGYAPEKIALRRAICTAYNTEEEIRIIRHRL
jgi:hypothetical protein